MMLPSLRLSLTPRTVTVCGTFQVAGVNVTLFGCTVPSLVSLLDSPTITLASGGVLRTIVKVSVSRNSETTNPVVGVTVNPATSLSTLVADTSDGSMPAHAASLETIGDSTIV